MHNIKLLIHQHIQRPQRCSHVLTHPTTRAPFKSLDCFMYCVRSTLALVSAEPFLFFNLRRLKQTLVGGGVGAAGVVLAVLPLSASMQDLLWRYHLMTSSMISQTRACTEPPATVERCLLLRSLGSLIQPLQKVQHFMNVNSIFPLCPRFKFLLNVFLYNNKVCNSVPGLP